MKKADYYDIDPNQNKIHFVQSDETYKLSSMSHVELITKRILKNTFDTILNATANALTSSIGNGNEKIQIIIRIEFENGDEEIIKMNETPLVKGNLDYYELLEHARKLKNALKKERILQ